MISDTLTMIGKLGGEMFKNMKIPVENNLDEVVRELERLGYREDIRNPTKMDNIYTYDSGDFSILDVDCSWGVSISLAELKEM